MNKDYIVVKDVTSRCYIIEKTKDPRVVRIEGELFDKNMILDHMQRIIDLFELDAKVVKRGEEYSPNQTVYGTYVVDPETGGDLFYTMFRPREEICVKGKIITSKQFVELLKNVEVPDEEE